MTDTFMHGHLGELEVRNCFKQEPHSMHDWHSQYWCTGTGLDEDDKVIVDSTPENRDDTDKLLDGRRATYGDVVDNAKRVAQMWNGYLGIDVITPADMMMMMTLYKQFRFKITPDYADNINDTLGYAKIVRTVQEATGGLIEAETVKEYQAKKAQGDQSEGQMIESWAKRTGNPYANVERDDTIMGSDGRDHRA